MITKNFRLNALANQYAAALYQHITTTSGGHFMIDAGSQPIRVEIAGGVKGVRDLIDGYALEALKEHYQHGQWEGIGIELLGRCVNAGGLTPAGIEIWQSMTADMGATVAGRGNA